MNPNGHIYAQAEDAIEVAASIQNHGSGDINAVAGWDGTTLDPAHYGDAGVFGNNVATFSYFLIDSGSTATVAPTDPQNGNAVITGQFTFAGKNTALNSNMRKNTFGSLALTN